MYTQSKLLFPVFFSNSALYNLSFYPHQLLPNLSVDRYCRIYCMDLETIWKTEKQNEGLHGLMTERIEDKQVSSVSQ